MAACSTAWTPCSSPPPSCSSASGCGGWCWCHARILRGPPAVPYNHGNDHGNDMTHVTDILTNLLAFAFALGVIIIVHEAGHLMVAKAFGVRVLTFSVGFGRRLWGFRRGETEYRVSLVPLGGYVRLGGENPEEVSDDPREFLNKPRWQRILVYLAGPAMNVLLAVVLIAGLFMAGIEVR